jgi:hypothetical protein
MTFPVIPAKAGTQEHPLSGPGFRLRSWAPAFAGVTGGGQ